MSYHEFIWCINWGVPPGNSDDQNVPNAVERKYWIIYQQAIKPSGHVYVQVSFLKWPQFPVLCLQSPLLQKTCGEDEEEEESDDEEKNPKSCIHLYPEKGTER